MKKLTLLTLLLFPLLGYAQEFRGKITDIYNLPIINAYIINKVNVEHTNSNKNGEFTIKNTSIGDTLVISNINYFTTTVIVTKKHLDQINEIQLKEHIVDLSEIIIVNNIKATNVITTIDLQANPVNSSQEILRTVPGLFIGQHAGGGKAEQIFLRAFDIDHGTDISISMDGIPVNMVSHAHGQGYADLHFIIPETIEKIDYGKGPYYPSKGNFNTAGYVEYKTKDKLDYSMIANEIGAFNTFRTVGLIKLLDQKKNYAYMAYEYLVSDGPFESPQNFSRYNMMGKYIADLPNNGKFSVIFSKFSSKWTASGQIPQRAVEDGTITRFGAIDDAEGGNTARTNASIQFTKFIGKNTRVQSNAWYSEYDFDLFSNFTFYLNNPDDGDQIRQKESRKLFGNSSEIKHTYKLGNIEFTSHAGIGFRHDEVKDLELSNTKNRINVLSWIKYGDVSESNIFGFYSTDINIGKFKINPSVRFDFFNFSYQNTLGTSPESNSDNSQEVSLKSNTEYHPNISGSGLGDSGGNGTPLFADKWMLSPKLNILYTANNKLQLFLKAGKGFHTNDTRVVVSGRIDQIVPAAYSADLGGIWKPFDRLILNIATWYIYLEQEFVYVGDEGIVEPSGKTRRYGIDYSMRLQLSKWLYFTGDLNYSIARFTELPEGENYVPLAPNLTTAGGLYFKHQSGLSGGVRYRYLENRPANEDNSVVAKGYFITDCNVNYSYKNWTLAIDIQNLFDREWNETQFNTESRMFDEYNGVEEIHFTPGTPFFLRGKIIYRF